MKRYIFASSLSLLLIGVDALLGLEIYHRAPTQIVEGVPVLLEVIPPSFTVDPDAVTLHLRPEGQLHFQEMPFVYGAGTYHCNIPAAFVIAPTLEYYISASFGAEGFAAFPREDPVNKPQRVTVTPFDAFKFRSEGSLDREKIQDVSVIPWKVRKFRPSKFPVRYFPKPSSDYEEVGYIRINGNRAASVQDLMDALFYTTKQQGAQAVTDLKIGVYTSHPAPELSLGIITLEAVYLQRKEQD